jgi:hypothetical protein
LGEIWIGLERYEADVVIPHSKTSQVLRFNTPTCKTFDTNIEGDSQIWAR